MATYTSNYGWIKPSGSDNVDISVLNNNLDDQDSTIHDAFLNMAPPFSESSTYAVDDIVLYGTGLYKCHTAVVTPGSWTGSTNWQVYKLSEGGGGGLTLGETSSTAYRGDRGKTAYDHSQTTGNPHGTTKSDVGLGNVPNVSTNDQEPTFTEASTRNNIASGEKLSIMLGKISKFFNDLKTVAFSGSFSDLSNKPENANTFQGTIAEWNALSTAEKKAYDHASIPDSIDGGVTFPANKVVMTGGGNVEDALDDLSNRLVAQSSGTGTFNDNLNELATAYYNLSANEKNNSYLIVGTEKYYFSGSIGRFTRLPIFYNNEMALGCANISQTPANTNLYSIGITTQGTTFSNLGSSAGRKIYLYTKTN